MYLDTPPVTTSFVKSQMVEKVEKQRKEKETADQEEEGRKAEEEKLGSNGDDADIVGCCTCVCGKCRNSFC